MKIISPKQAACFFRPRLSYEVEEFWAATLNTEKQVTAARCLFRGTVDHCLFHPRDIFRFACLNNAAALIVAHSHPSGNTEPSTEDIAVTEQLLTLSLVLQIPLVDHLILARRRYYSFLAAGKLQLNSKDPALPNCR